MNPMLSAQSYRTRAAPALAIALRFTEARRYTPRTTPIFTAIHHPLEDVFALAG